jgi:hypothetical protein
MPLTPLAITAGAWALDKYSTRLLRDCLALAVMPPDEKQAVLESLYVPPAAAGGGEGA